MPGEQMTKSWGGGKIQGTKWWTWSSKLAISANKRKYLENWSALNNQYDIYASGETNVDTDLKLDMSLQLQGPESPSVLQFPSPMSTISDHVIRFLELARETYFIPLSCLQSFASMFIYKRTVMVKRSSLSLLLVDHKAASPFQRCNLSLHRWPSSLLMQGSWVCFQGGCCKPPGVFIEGSKTRMEGWWQKRKFLPPEREACGRIWIPTA